MFVYASPLIGGWIADRGLGYRRSVILGGLMRMRGLMMGGWFLATAIGNKLTAIGKLWDRWSHSDFFVLLGSMALVMAVVLFLLLKPLKKAMPGV